ncbi:MAG TPA: hypothetical protein VMM83_07680 [Longimicrobiales bacterium]|nr:hypothetical protein [Longimicrobiales bacterium]
MKCQDALERMLEAEPSALKGDDTADPGLARHLRECARCRAVAEVLVEELDALDAGLDHVARPSRAAPRRRVATWAPLAAAAVLAAVLLLGRDAGRTAIPDRGPDVDVDPPARVAVTLPADRGGAVMSTNNPKITVVWLYERSER